MKEYFSERERQCHCGCKLTITNSKLDTMLREARIEANIPFNINSWTRCKFHNQSSRVNGSKSSSHLLGDAVDIKYNNDRSLFIMVDALLNAGFKRILIYPKSKFIHTDVTYDKVQDIIKIMEQ